MDIHWKHVGSFRIFNWWVPNPFVKDSQNIKNLIKHWNSLHAFSKNDEFKKPFLKVDRFRGTHRTNANGAPETLFLSFTFSSKVCMFQPKYLLTRLLLFTHHENIDKINRLPTAYCNHYKTCHFCIQKRWKNKNDIGTLCIRFNRILWKAL